MFRQMLDYVGKKASEDLQTRINLSNIIFSH